MRDRLNVPPTRSSLLDLKRQLGFLREGYRLLERKRELLTRLVYEKLAEYQRLNRSTRDVMITAYRWLSITQLRMGSRRIRQLAVGMPEAVEARVLARRNMSVQYPAPGGGRNCPVAPTRRTAQDTETGQRAQVQRHSPLRAHHSLRRIEPRRRRAQQPLPAKVTRRTQ